MDAQRGREQVVGRPVMLAAQEQPVDVALAEPDRPGISAVSWTGRGNRVMFLYCHDVPRFTCSHMNLSCPACP
jgi:hypothetical protein